MLRIEKKVFLVFFWYNRTENIATRLLVLKQWLAMLCRANAAFWGKGFAWWSLLRNQPALLCDCSDVAMG
jgi:Sec7-like guanine-nucleotide exchange factor